MSWWPIIFNSTVDQENVGTFKTLEKLLNDLLSATNLAIQDVLFLALFKNNCPPLKNRGQLFLNNRIFKIRLKVKCLVLPDSLQKADHLIIQSFKCSHILMISKLHLAHIFHKLLVES